MGGPLKLRPVGDADVAAIAAIYAYYVRETVISFEADPPGEAEMARRIAAIAPRYPYLVAERDGAVIGYAYAGELYARAAYRWVAETTVYLAHDERGRGVGRALYGALIEELRTRGFYAAVGKVTLPNAASAGLHAALGFSLAGQLPQVGYKFGAWYDVGIFQREIAARPPLPDEPRRD